MRAAFPADFPEVVIQQPWGTGVRPIDHPGYRAAKAGDPDAAARFVSDTVTADALERLRSLTGCRRPIIVAVHAEEASGRNAIPERYGYLLSHDLGLPLDEGIVQANRPQRTGKSNLYRILNRVEFDGPVVSGQDYLMVDDHVSQGGTLADLRNHLELQGGHVIGARTLTGIPEGQILVPTARTLAALRDKIPATGRWWKTKHGYDIDGLTEHEARYLLRYNSLDSLRNQLAAGTQAGTSSPLPRDRRAGRREEGSGI